MGDITLANNGAGRLNSAFRSLMDHADATDQRLLRLDPRDNVLTVTRAIAAGELIVVRGRGVVVGESLALGHKIAACDVPAGGKIIKYGVSIGSATRGIAAGDHVHTHNLRSDYLPTYLRENQEHYFRQHG